MQCASRKRVHFILSEGKDFTGEFWAETACGFDCEFGGNWKGTVFPELVTCKNCLRVMESVKPQKLKLNILRAN